jgi:hypothetical protein
LFDAFPFRFPQFGLAQFLLAQPAFDMLILLSIERKGNGMGAPSFSSFRRHRPKPFFFNYGHPGVQEKWEKSR